MSTLLVRGRGPVHGTFLLPGDKSITHRAFLLGAMARSRLRVRGALEAADTGRTLAALEQLGTGVERDPEGGITLVPGAWREPPAPLDCGNSGTTLRLLAGMLAAHRFTVTLTGDESLLRRPMQRIVVPLTRMGARVESRSGCAPLRITGGNLLCGTTHQLPVASAQVKSAILLAAARAGVGVRLREPGPSRDHTERLLALAGRTVKRLGGGWLELKAGPGNLDLPAELSVPRDPSSAAFLWAAAAVTGGRVETPGVGINPTRVGVFALLRQAGVRIQITDERENAMGEPVATVVVEGGELAPFTLAGDEVVRAIDEIPVLAVVAARAAGRSVVRDAGELRAKESDRIHALCQGLSAFGVPIKEESDGFVIHGGGDFAADVEVDAVGDHRLAMAFAVAGLCGRGTTRIANAECIDVSFPSFPEVIGAQWET